MNVTITEAGATWRDTLAAFCADRSIPPGTADAIEKTLLEGHPYTDGDRYCVAPAQNPNPNPRQAARQRLIDHLMAYAAEHRGGGRIVDAEEAETVGIDIARRHRLSWGPA